jgi:uncharacterized protein YbjQ (UPF0145 family)
MEGLIQIGILVILLVLGLSAGRIAERRHFARLDERERAIAGVVIVTDLRSFPGGADLSARPTLVAGHAVISSDYFKTFVSGLKKIVGGELRSLESLMNRARREAILRMIDQARASGCDTVCNVRIEGFDIAGSSSRKANKAMVIVSVQASGTAYKRRAA